MFALEDDEIKEYGLCQMAWALPFWYVRVYEYIEEDAALADLGVQLGMGLTCNNIWYDLAVVRRYGNQGAHPDEKQMYVAPLAAKPDTFVATIRIAVATLAALKKYPRGYSSRL